jgi:hypothetical protein
MYICEEECLAALWLNKGWKTLTKTDSMLQEVTEEYTIHHFYFTYPWYIKEWSLINLKSQNDSIHLRTKIAEFRVGLNTICCWFCTGGKGGGVQDIEHVIHLN